MKIAVIPGSYDPITLGHVDIIQRSIPLFDKIIIAIGQNSDKKYMFSLEQRKHWIRNTFEKESKISVESYTTLTSDFCKHVHANYMVRGLRNATDFDFEKTISQLNNKLNQDCETIFLITSPENALISSTIVREIIRGNGDYTKFVPNCVRLNEI